MTEQEVYQEHIRYTHDTYCRIVIRHTSFDAARTLAARLKREISLISKPSVIKITLRKIKSLQIKSNGYLHVPKYLCETGDQSYEHQGICACRSR